jgi:hypothetical protein
VTSVALRAVAAISVAGVVLGAVQPAQAAVSKDYARETWDNSKCKAFPFEQVLVTGDITDDGRSDAVMLWACSPGAGGAYPRVLSYWIDGRPIKQKSLTTPLPQADAVRVKNGQVIVKGGDYSGVGVPLCCADVRVTLTYEWNGRKLVLVDEERRQLG